MANHRRLGWFSCSLIVLLVNPAAAAEPPPPPFAGFDLVYGASGQRVLGPEAAQIIDQGLSQPADLTPECRLGDIRLQPSELGVALLCGTETVQIRLMAKDRAPSAAADRQTADFVAVVPAAWLAPCDPTCASRRSTALTALLVRVRAVEKRIPWQRAAPAQGAANGPDAALDRAQSRLAAGEKLLAGVDLQAALQAQPVAQWPVASAFRLALLATAIGDSKATQQALASIQRWIAQHPLGAQAQPQDAKYAVALGLAARALARDAEAVTDGVNCLKSAEPCDILPLVCALTALAEVKQAGSLLDAGPLAAADSPRSELLQLRYGLAMLAGDSAAELLLAKKMLALQPNSPIGLEVLASGQERAGDLLAATMTWLQLSQVAPTRAATVRLALAIEALADSQPTGMAILKKMLTPSQGPAAQLAMSIVLYRQGQLSQSAQILAALKENGAVSDAYRALNAHWLGDATLAREQIDNALTRDPDEPLLYLVRAQIARSLSLPRALQDLERFNTLTTRPRHPALQHQADRANAVLGYLKRGELPPDWEKPGEDRPAFLPQDQSGTAASPVVVSGSVWPADTLTPTAVTAQGPVTAVDLAQAPTCDAPQNKSTAKPPSPPSDERTWLPWAILAALGAALAVRFLRRNR